MKNLFSILLVLVLCSCGSEKGGTEIRTIEEFKDTLFVQGHKVDINDFRAIYNSYIFDSILVLQLSSSYSLNRFSAYSLNTFQKLGDFIQTGRGPDEFMLPMIIPQPEVINNGDIHIWITDFPSKIVRLNLTRTLSAGETCIDKRYDFVRPGKNNMLYESNDVFVLDDGIFFMNKSLDRSKNADYMNPRHMYIFYDLEHDKCLDTLFYRYPLSGWNYFSKDDSKVVNISYNEDVLSIYDLPEKEELVICHTVKKPEELFTVRKPDAPRPDFVYTSCTIKGNLIFLLYRYHEFFGSPSAPDKHKRNIHIFSLDGIPLYNLEIREEIMTIGFDKRTSTLYGLEKEGQLYAYDLKEVISPRTF